MEKINVKLLKERIESKGLKNNFVIKKLGIGRTTFHSRLNEKEFKLEEIEILKRLGLL